MVRFLVRAVVVVLLLAGGGAGFAYLLATKPEAAPRPSVRKVWPVDAIIARYQTVRPTIDAYGEVTAAREADIRVPVGGALVFAADALVNGAEVNAGDRLAKIDPFKYELAVREAEGALAAAKATLAETEAEVAGERQLLSSAEAQITLVQRDVARRTELAERGAGSKAAVDTAAISLNDAERLSTQKRQMIDRLDARIAQLNAEIAQREAALDRARKDLRDTVITAPFDGYLTDVDAAIGAEVRAGDQLARLIARDRLDVRFDLRNEDLARLLESGDPLIGRPIMVGWKVGARTFEFPAHLTRVTSRIDPNTGGVGVYGTIDTEAVDAPLRPGAFVSVAVPDRTYENVLMLPDRAVDRDGTIYVIADDGTATPRTVTVLRRAGTDLVVAADIAPDTQIIARHFPELGPGVRVEPRR